MKKHASFNFFWVALRFLAISVSIFLMQTTSLFAGTISGRFECYRPWVPGYWDVKGSPTGKWSPFHNTNKWEFKAVPGFDYFQKKINPQTNKRIYLKCKAKHGFLQRDIDGLKDQCGYYRNAIPAKNYEPVCKVASLHYLKWHGSCVTAQNSRPSTAPSQYVIPFGDSSFCPSGGAFRYVSKAPITISNGEKLNGLAEIKLSCPAGEKYTVKIKNNQQQAVKNSGMVVFSVPDNTSKMFFSASLKPTQAVTPFLSEHLGFMINDRVASVANSHLYYPASGPAPDIGRTAYSITPQTGYPVIFQERWEPEIFPQFVHFGVSLNMIPNAGITPTVAGGMRKVVARFGGTTGSSPRTEVAAAKIEYCAKLKMTKSKGAKLKHRRVLQSM